MDMAAAEGGLPALWSSEQPALYHLVVALVRSGDGAVVDAESCQVTARQQPLFVRNREHACADPGAQSCRDT